MSIVCLDVFDSLPSDREPEVTSEAIELTILHMINRYHIIADRASISDEWIAICDIAPSVLFALKPNDYHAALAAATDQNGDLVVAAKLELLGVLESVLHLSLSQILKAYKKITEEGSLIGRRFCFQFVLILLP